jgi:hypothetical protein
MAAAGCEDSQTLAGLVLHLNSQLGLSIRRPRLVLLQGPLHYYDHDYDHDYDYYYDYDYDYD